MICGNQQNEEKSGVPWHSLEDCSATLVIWLYCLDLVQCPPLRLHVQDTESLSGRSDTWKALVLDHTNKVVRKLLKDLQAFHRSLWRRQQHYPYTRRTFYN